MNTTKGKIATKQNKTKGLVEKIFSSWKISDITNSLNGFNRLKKRHTVSLTWVEWHLIGGACLISVRDKTTPCLSQLGFCSVPMPGSCPGNMDLNWNWKKKKTDILCYYIYMTCWKKQIYKEKKWINACQGPTESEDEERIQTIMGYKRTFWVKAMFSFLIPYINCHGLTWLDLLNKIYRMIL